MTIVDFILVDWNCLFGAAEKWINSAASCIYMQDCSSRPQHTGWQYGVWLLGHKAANTVSEPLISAWDCIYYL